MPSKLSDEATSDLENAASLFARLVAEVGDQRNDEVGVNSLEDIRRHDCLKHSGGSQRSNGINSDVFLFSFLGKGLSEAVKGELSGGIVDLTEAAEETSSRGGVDDSAIALLSHDVPGSLGAFVGAIDMDLKDELPVLVFHFLERDVSEDACVVQENVDSSEIINGSFDDFFSKLN